jgi:hypothetical protein
MRLWVFKRHFSTIFQLYIDLWATLPGTNMQHSLCPTIWSDIVVGRESGYLKIFFYISRGEHVILWSMRICKRTFFPVCRMSGYVYTLVYFYFAPFVSYNKIYTIKNVSCWKNSQDGSIYNIKLLLQNI